MFLLKVRIGIEMHSETKELCKQEGGNTVSLAHLTGEYKKNERLQSLL